MNTVFCRTLVEGNIFDPTLLEGMPDAPTFWEMDDPPTRQEVQCHCGSQEQQRCWAQQPASSITGVYLCALRSRLTEQYVFYLLVWLRGKGALKMSYKGTRVIQHPLLAAYEEN